MKMLLICFALALLFCPSVQAKDKGQIINVNQNYQVAFTDLASSALRPGDVVKVFVSDDVFVYMQVMESSSIMSKLGISQKEDSKTNLNDLKRVAIGNSVIKLGEPQQEKAAVPAVKTAPEPAAAMEDSSRAEEIQELLARLKEKKEEIRRLQEVNQFLRSQIPEKIVETAPAKIRDDAPRKNDNREEGIAQVKTRLQKMKQILDQE